MYPYGLKRGKGGLLKPIALASHNLAVNHNVASIFHTGKLLLVRDFRGDYFLPTMTLGNKNLLGQAFYGLLQLLSCDFSGEGWFTTPIHRAGKCHLAKHHFGTA